ncbi:SpoIIIAH-like family protein [Lentibacillus sp. Marseille-P4043]|uniref:SpoIIIAH-like family protein n=1 Tax=Lentibacillus sp. Marseille-P4043 TaxID=2040293 RepID=UPI000D0AF4A6|nr:SpoIIIAH-like family protein [Lentibacillus sp. Marseille-P4043]
MLKKQTVWLLTMLSLMIVLSVYYMTSPDSEEVAFLENGKEEADETATTEQTEGEDAKVDEITNMGEDELFTNIRLEVQDERSKQISRLEDVVASSTASTEEKNQAYEDIEVLEQRGKKESILEESILATADYQDVLVRFDKNDENIVHVNVKVDELPKQEAVNIMQMVRDEFGEIQVDVNYQPAEG